MYTAIVCIALFVTLSVANPKCTLQISSSPDYYISFGDANCVFHNSDIQTVEAWLYPTSEGHSFSDGIVFNSGWYKVLGVEKAFVMSIKENHQLMGYVFTRPIGSSSIAENIGASASNFLKPNAWNHVMWNPKEGRFHVANVTSERGTIYGATLNGIGSFTPGSEVLVGQSLAGRISALRVWSSMETPASVTTYFETRATSCLEGVGPAVLAFWDFTTCSSCRINSFVGGSCGKFHPNKHAFKWIENVTQYELINPTADVGHSWVDVCSAPTSCKYDCHPHHNNHPVGIDYVPNVNNNPTTTNAKKCWFSYFLKNPNMLILAIAVLVLALVVVITLCCRCCRKNQVKPTEETEQLSPESSSSTTTEDNEVELPVVTSDMKPVYIPISQ